MCVRPQGGALSLVSGVLLLLGPALVAGGGGMEGSGGTLMFKGEYCSFFGGGSWFVRGAFLFLIG